MSTNPSPRITQGGALEPMRKKWPGRPYPLGATFDGAGTNFALFSSVAERVQLCLFESGEEQHCIDLDLGIGQIWNVYLPEVGPGTTDFTTSPGTQTGSVFVSLAVDEEIAEQVADVASQQRLRLLLLPAGGGG